MIERQREIKIETERVTQRERERGRERNRQTERQRERETESQRDIYLSLQEWYTGRQGWGLGGGWVINMLEMHNTNPRKNINIKIGIERDIYDGNR